MSNPTPSSADMQKLAVELVVLAEGASTGSQRIRKVLELLSPVKERLDTLEAEHTRMREALEKIAIPDREGKARQEYAKSVLSRIRSL